MFPEIVVIVIRGADGRFFVHQRRADKETFPLRYGLGAGGRMEPTESPAAAAARELAEEAGLATPLTHLFDFRYQDEEVERRLHVFETVVSSQTSVSAENGEWNWCGWLPESEVDGLRQAGKLCPDTASLFDQYSALRRPPTGG